jgi:putative Mg2+ transporter-C (MgtC) family protein
MFELTHVEVDMLFRVLYAAFLGLLIGVERKGGPRGAGPRTFSLICMGSALFTVLSVLGFPNNPEPSRLAAQIVTGVGFIGAGVVWRQKGDIIHGITTAAAIWVSAAIGIAVALGFFVMSFIVTFATIVILARGHPLREAKEHISDLV